MRRFAERFVFSLLIALFTSLAVAENPYRTSVGGDVTAIRALSEDLQDGVARKATPLRASRAVRLSFAAKGLGKVNVVLNNVSYKSWDSFFESSHGKQPDLKDVILVQGYIPGRQGAKVRVGGSIYNSRGHPRLFLVLNRTEHSKRSAYVEVRLDGAKDVLPARVTSVPKAAASRLECGNGDDHESQAVYGSSEAVHTSGAASGAATIWTEADPEYYAIYGADTNAHIATLVSAASAIYQNQMGISLQVGTQRVVTSQSGNPYTSSDSGQLLSQFQDRLRSNNSFGNATAYHLFSGKDFSGSVIGLAYVGVICAYEDYSVGTTQRYHDAADASIFAHELGHNFGAGHDSTDSHSMMAPYVNVPGSTYFSSASISAIQSHLSQNTTCLDQNSGGGGGSPGQSPTPTPGDPSAAPGTAVSVSVNRSGSMSILMSVDSVQDGCILQLYGSTSQSGTGSLLREVTPTALNTRIRLAGLRDPKRGRSSLYFYTVNVCASDVSESDVEGVSLNIIRLKTSQSIGAVLSAIGNALGS